ncbi:hypothetical protein QBC43DRAFT_137653 [Cladorrhinum sp. PSN259]|nr:hypothetical protein QBC43DRAFT_137653 [Cladorrhinum sp. PSN259]
MDPLTTIGLVSGILNFVQFAGKLVQGGVEIYQNGGLAENATLQDVITTMESFHSRHQLSGSDGDLNSILKDCSSVSGHLLQLLRKLEPPSSKGGFRAAWRSTTASWNNVFHDKEKRKLEEKLARCHGRLGLLLACSTNVNVEKLVLSAQDRGAATERLQKTVDELNGLLRQGSDMEWLTDSIRKELKRTIDVRERELLNISCHAHILRSIRYEKMKERSNGLKQRLSEIEDQQRENGGTFQWIFESEASNVTDNEEERMMKQKARKKWNKWIKSTDAGIFHIAGKFGSGKSTLMQFLYDHPRTQEDLEQWAGYRKLLKINYYFSVVIGGTQQLLQGLFRTLLYAILDQCPSLIREVLPKTWEQAMIHPWQANAVDIIEVDDSAISTALDQILSGCYPELCFAIFIDGLDEYQDPEGRDQSDLVDLIKKWAYSKNHNANVKICVASREDAAFVNKFPPETTLRLHELTRYDMERFTEERLQRIRDASIRNQLVKEIPTRAQGVFLWARLVVQEIREDLEVGDPSMDVLELFPSGLRPLLSRMMESIPSRHRQKAYLTFAMLIELSRFNFPQDQPRDSDGSRRFERRNLFLSGFAYSFCDEYCKDRDFVYKMSPSEWWKTDYVKKDPAAARVLERAGKVGLQLRAWCKGLVETVPFRNMIQMKQWNDHVEIMRLVFTHRSIKDYLEEPAVQAELLSGLGGLSPSDAISQLLLAEFTHNGRLYDVTNFNWASALLSFRNEHHREDKPPFRFLDRWHHISRQRKPAIVRPPHKVDGNADSSCHQLVIHASHEIIAEAYFEKCSDQIGGPWSDYAIHDPLLISILKRENDYPTWKLQNEPDTMTDSFRAVTIMYSLLCNKGRSLPKRPQSSYKLLDLMLQKGGQQCLESRTSVALPPLPKEFALQFTMEPLTIWQHYLLVELFYLKNHFFPRPAQSQINLLDELVVFGKIAEAFLRAGADPFFSFSFVDAETDMDAVLRMGQDVSIHMRFPEPGSSHLAILGHYQDILEYSNPFTLRDWVELLDIPNRGTLLELIDRGLSTRTKNTGHVDLQPVDQTSSSEIPPSVPEGRQLLEEEKDTNTQASQIGPSEAKGQSHQPNVTELTSPLTTPEVTILTSFQTSHVISFVLGVLFAYIFLAFWK